jgi:putative DNA primase/helicase
VQVVRDGRSGWYGNWRTGEKSGWRASDRGHKDTKERHPARQAIAVAEGYATAWSITHVLDGWSTFVAFSAGNLLRVALAVRRRFPHARITICGDNDRNGVGRAKAEEAAAQVQGGVAIPPFNEAEVAGGLTDWNDFARRLKEGVRAWTL